MKTNIPLERIQGCLMGVAIGDALGMPVETMKRADIIALNGGRGVTCFIGPVQKRIWDTAGLKPGDTTDDWQLTRAVARSLIRCKGTIDITDCAKEHVSELNRSAFGWGRASQSAIEAIRRGERDPFQDPLPPAKPGKGCGNGVIMKIAPLAIASVITVGEDPGEKLLWWQCRRLGLLTHPDIRASIAAYAVALLMKYVALKPEMKGLNGEPFFDRIIGMIIDAESEEGGEHSVSERLQKMLRSLDSSEILRQAVGNAYNALDTVGFVTGTFLRNPLDFRAGVLEAVNAGGDTDTNASIVGALIGLNCGLEAIPKEWRDFNPLFQEALELGKSLASL